MSDDRGLGNPPAELTDFPAEQISADRDLYRCVSKPRKPWWFGSDGSQRFDLKEPRGTTYVALDIESAIREKLRRRLLEGGILDEVMVDAIELHTLRLPRDGRYANTGSGRAQDFGANRELSTIMDKELTCRWAEAFADAGFDGIFYASRFTSPMECNSLAVFGDAGERTWPSEPMAGRQAIRRSGLVRMVARSPFARGADIKEPPLPGKP
ncbi:RES family NAD+ phosphorylase [Crystallibacter degradans]|uniref:RES family NAD+ phosphorylase n=1 Tax=Crystallibacter degradans TaxID=2726743 RepID=UPI00147558BE|nr:RES family NAD+ phosphorylase [Arthrobacter sp. SF27]NMR28660.1 RES family NAD+ phosphorylase [Arthrobacter sp. SF27]